MIKLIKGNKTAELFQDGVLTHRFDITDPETVTMVDALEVDETEEVESDASQHPEQPEIDYTQSILS
jgi:hypothetical protein